MLPIVMKLKPLDFLEKLGDWKLYKKGMCDSCIGLCCYMPVEVTTEDLLRIGIITDFHLELKERDLIKEAVKHPAVEYHRVNTNKFTLTQKIDRSCYYLSKEGTCTIYDNRPDTCRNHPKIGPRANYCAYYPKD